MAILLCASALWLSAHSRGSRGDCREDTGSEGCPGSCSVVRGRAGTGTLACHSILDDIFLYQKDAGRRVGVTLTSDLGPFLRVQGRAPLDQGRRKLPSGAWSPWRRIPSTPPGRKVSQGVQGQPQCHHTQGCDLWEIHGGCALCLQWGNFRWWHRGPRLRPAAS